MAVSYVRIFSYSGFHYTEVLLHRGARSKFKSYFPLGITVPLRHCLPLMSNTTAPRTTSLSRYSLKPHPLSPCTVPLRSAPWRGRSVGASTSSCGRMETGRGRTLHRRSSRSSPKVRVRSLASHTPHIMVLPGKLRSAPSNSCIGRGRGESPSLW